MTIFMHCWPYGTYVSMYHVSAQNWMHTKPNEMICHLSTKTDRRVPVCRREKSR